MAARGPTSSSAAPADDTLTGGTGADIFVFGPGHGNDTITDFDTSQDMINLSWFGAGLSYADLTIAATGDGTGTVITIPGQDGGDPVTITLQGVTTSDVTEDLFEFSNAGDDTITGTTADETITGGTGDDTLTGGGGSDVFVFAPGDGDDTITDFSTVDDRIDLRAYGAIDFERPDHHRDRGRHGGRSSPCRGTTAARSRCRA